MSEVDRGVTLISLCIPQARIFSTNLVGSGGISGNEASRSFAAVVGGCIRGLGMGRVRLSMGGGVVMASSGRDLVLMSELWAAPGLRWRRLVVECQS